MNKYGWLFFTSILSIITTLIAQEISGLSTSGSIGATMPENPDLTIGTITSFIRTYFNLITFNVNGVPALVSMFFIALNIVIIYIVLELVIKAYDAVVPL